MKLIDKGLSYGHALLSPSSTLRSINDGRFQLYPDCACHDWEPRFGLRWDSADGIWGLGILSTPRAMSNSILPSIIHSASENVWISDAPIPNAIARVSPWNGKHFMQVLRSRDCPMICDDQWMLIKLGQYLMWSSWCFGTDARSRYSLCQIPQR